MVRVGWATFFFDLISIFSLRLDSGRQLCCDVMECELIAHISTVANMSYSEKSFREWTSLKPSRKSAAKMAKSNRATRSSSKLVALSKRLLGDGPFAGSSKTGDRDRRWKDIHVTEFNLRKQCVVRSLCTAGGGNGLMLGIPLNIPPYVRPECPDASVAPGAKAFSRMALSRTPFSTSFSMVS